jgi:hypothetical protein
VNEPEATSPAGSAGVGTTSAGVDASAAESAAEANPEPAWSPPGAAATASPERPEVLVGAAFAGGLLTAFVLKRLAN